MKPIIITELANNGTLSNFIQNSPSKKLTFTQKLIISYGISAGMAYLHSHDIIHRDLKPENILIDDFLFAKISDFGLSKIKNNNDAKIMESKAGVLKGTPIYMSPEIWERCEYSKKSDVYAFGMILYQIFTDEKPFQNCHFYQIPLMIQKGYRPHIGSEVPLAYKELIERCLSKEVSERPTFDEIVEKFRNEKEFITSDVDEKEYRNYIKYIENYKTSFGLKTTKKLAESLFRPIKISNEFKFNELPKYFPYKEFIHLQKEESRILVKCAEIEADKQFQLGQYLIEGQYEFEVNVQLGIEYLKRSIQNGNRESLIYYIRHLIKGEIIPFNEKKVRKLLSKQMDEQDPLYFLLLGKLYKKMKNYTKAIECFESSSSKGNSESIYLLGKMKMKGQGFQKNVKEGIKYYTKAIFKQNALAKYKYGKYLIDNKIDCERGKMRIKDAADDGLCRALYDYGMILYNLNQKEKSFQIFKISAEKGHRESMMSYASCLYIKTVSNPPETDELLEESYRYFRKAAYKGHIASMHYISKLLTDNRFKEYNLNESVKYSRIAANNGCTEAMITYGQYLHRGSVIAANYEEAIKYYKMAIDKVNEIAMNNYGYMLENGQGIERNPEEAIKYYKMAIKRKNATAMNNYAHMLHVGNGIEANTEEAIKYYKMSIDLGNTTAMRNYAYMLHHGDGIKPNINEAIKYYKMAIDNGDTDAMVDCAILLHESKELDKSEELKYLKKAIDLGNAAAMYTYAAYLFNGEGVSINKEEAIKYFKMSADEGDSDGMYEYGNILFYGKGVPVDKEEAFKYYKKGADKGNGNAASRYAYLLDTGDGIAVNKREAIKYYKIAIEKGNAEAMNNYAYMFDIGNGVPVDKREAVKYYKMAIEKGSAGAMNNYAYDLFNGDGIEPNKEEGIKFYKMAAEAGSSAAAFHYAEILHHGDGIQADHELAVKYYRMAIERGENRAKEGLKLLTDEK